MAASDGAARNRVRREILERFFVRAHMTLILASVVLLGVVSSKVLLDAGITSMLLRYPIAVVLSYSAFFAFVRVWVWYVSAPRRWSVDADAGDLVDLADGVSRTPPSIGPNDGGRFSFGGGRDFGGGGGTDRWGEADVTPVARAVAAAPQPAPSGTAGWSPDLDFDDGVVLLVFGVLVLIVFGAGVYLVYQAPVILTEAAFEAVLASGLVNASRRLERGGWARSVLRATWVPFAIVLAIALVFGAVARIYRPDATRIADVLAERHTRK